MSFIDKILSQVAPHECLGCSIEGTLACSACLNAHLISYEECYRCRRPSVGSMTCGECIEVSQIRKVRAATVYRGVSKDLVWRLKSSGAQAAASTMASLMLALLDASPCLIVSAPTATTRVRQRGYDQSKLIARQLSKLSGQPWADCVARSGQAHQVGSDKEHRLRQLSEAFRATKISLIHGRCIVLVDDVITTGATIEAVANVLLAAGAAQVDALAFARPALNEKHPALS